MRDKPTSASASAPKFADIPVATFMEALARKLAAFEATLAALPEAEAAVRRNWLNGLLAETTKMFALTDIVPAPAAELPEAEAAATLAAHEATLAARLNRRRRSRAFATRR